MSALINRGALPSELGGLVDTLNDIATRVRTLEAPDAQQLGLVVKRLQETVEKVAQQQVELEEAQAQLSTVVENIDETLSNFIATGVQPIVDQAVVNALAGNVSIGGSLTVAGIVKVPGARGTFVGGTTPDRVAAWIAGDGTLGHTS
jgi:uncharacterized phage infection (PIP) family protein YhgE